MASKLVSGLVVIGAAVSSTLDAAFKTVEDRIKKLEAQGNNARVLEKTIGETLRLQDAWQKAHDRGAASAAGLWRSLENNRNGLRKQGVLVHQLREEYQALGAVARGSELKARGQQQIDQGKTDLKAAYGWAKIGVDTLKAPVKVSADYQALIRDMAIKANVANTPREAQLSQTVMQTAKDTGMGRNEVAGLVSKMLVNGMSLDKAQGYAPLAAKFAVGQGASAENTANLMRALELQAKIDDPKVMERALEAIALQGQEGNFEAADMARLLPALLKSASAGGLTGMEAVSQLGSMLQVQMSTGGSPDEAASQLNNWIEKLGTGDALKAAALTDSQSRERYEALSKRSLSASGALDENLAQRRQLSKQLWAETEQAVDNGMLAIGEALRPATDQVAKGITLVVGKLTELAGAAPPLVLGLAAVGVGFVAIKNLMAAYTLGKGLLNVLRGSLKIDPEVAKRVSASKAGGLGCVQSTVDCCVDNKGRKGRRRRKGPRGGARGQSGNSGNSRSKGAGGLKNPLTPSGLEKLPKGATALGVPGTALKDAASVAKGFKGGSLLSVISAGFRVADVYQNAKTQDEKAEGYGEVAGNLAGTLAGAAAGAAIGSAVPVIGTVIGGLIGGAFGAWGGSALGGALGKKMFGSDESLKRLPAAGPLMMANAGQTIPPVMGDIAKSFKPRETPLMMGQVVRSMETPSPSASTLATINPPQSFASQVPPVLEQQFSFAPYLSISVQGDVKDPAQLARELEPYLRFQFDEYSRQATARQLFDPAHV